MILFLDMKKVLLIDTSSNIEIRVGIEEDKEKYFIKRKIGFNKAQRVLPLIDLLLKKRGLKVSEISMIRVNVKYGSFTGVRVGLSVANAMSFALKVPVEKFSI